MAKYREWNCDQCGYEVHGWSNSNTCVKCQVENELKEVELNGNENVSVSDATTRDTDA